MYIEYNPNPLGKKVGDCVIRGLSIVTNKSWDETFIDLSLLAFKMKDMPSSNNVWESYLYNHGFNRKLLPDNCPNCYRVKDFTRDHHVGMYLLSTGTHVVSVIDGDYYDAWDSGNEIPVYYWYKERSK